MSFQPPVWLSERAGTCDVLLCVSFTLQSTLESGQEARIMQIDTSAAFDRGDHYEILYKLCSVGIGGFELSKLIQVLSNQSQPFMVVIVYWLT